MNQGSETASIVREIKRKTRKKYNAEEKIRIVLEGIRGEASISEVCRKEGINPNMYYKWSKEFLEAGKKRLQGDTEREATSNEVVGLRKENEQLKALVAEVSLKNRVLKKKLEWFGIRIRRGMMRYTQAEKMDIIRTVEESELGVRPMLREMDVNRSTFYEWYQRYEQYGYDGLANRKPNPKKFWNRIPEVEKEQVIAIALEQPEKSPL